MDPVFMEIIDMKDKNTIGQTTFLVLCSLAASVGTLSEATIFSNYHFLRAEVNSLLTFAVIAISMLTCYQLYKRYRRNWFSLSLCAMLSAISVYTIGFFPYSKERLLIAASFGVVLSAIYAGLHMSYSRRVIGDSAKAGFIKKTRNRRTQLGAVCIMILTLSVSTLLPCGNINPWYCVENPKTENVYASPDAWEESKTFDANIDTMVLLDDSKWSELNKEQRRKCLEVLKIVDCNYLGLSSDIDIVYDEPMEKSTLGTADFSNNQIRINSSVLEEEKSYIACMTIFHELRHFYQHSMVEIYKKSSPKERNLLAFRDAQKWIQDFDHYTSGEDRNFEKYASQSCEQDARWYAEAGCSEIYERIGKALGQGN